jgi:hypothetical protein
LLAQKNEDGSKREEGRNKRKEERDSHAAGKDIDTVACARHGGGGSKVDVSSSCTVLLVERVWTSRRG